DKPQITYVLSRQDAEHLPLDHKRLEARRNLVFDKMKAMIGYTETSFRCRMQFIQEYFDEHTESVCGICDVCIRKRKQDNLLDYESLRGEVLAILKDEAMSVEHVERRIAPKDREL